MLYCSICVKLYLRVNIKDIDILDLDKSRKTD